LDVPVVRVTAPLQIAGNEPPTRNVAREHTAGWSADEGAVRVTPTCARDSSFPVSRLIPWKEALSDKNQRCKPSSGMKSRAVEMKSLNRSVSIG
jgi:hypothetical protein